VHRRREVRFRIDNMVRAEKNRPIIHKQIMDPREEVPDFPKQAGLVPGQGINTSFGNKEGERNSF